MNSLLWLAVETTGVGEDGDFSLALPTEVSAIVTDEDWEPQGGFSAGVTLTKAHAQALKSDPQVFEFLKDRKALHKKETSSLKEIESDILDLLDDLEIQRGKVTLAGRGAAHFLQPVLRTHMPALEKYLSFYTMDTSQILRWMNYAGAKTHMRSIAPDLRSFQEIFDGALPSTGATLREVLTEAHQFRAAQEG